MGEYLLGVPSVDREILHGLFCLLWGLALMGGWSTFDHVLSLREGAILGAMFLMNGLALILGVWWKAPQVRLVAVGLHSLLLILLLIGSPWLSDALIYSALLTFLASAGLATVRLAVLLHLARENQTEETP